MEKKFLLIFIILFFLSGCASGPYYKVYTHNILKEVVLPDDLNYDYEQCGKYGATIAFNKSSMLVDRKLLNEIAEKCMEEKGWRVK